MRSRCDVLRRSRATTKTKDITRRSPGELSNFSRPATQGSAVISEIDGVVRYGDI